MDPNAFAPGFDDRLQTYIDEMRSLEPVSIASHTSACLHFGSIQSDPSRPVMIAGDPEKKKLQQVKENGGISYDMSLITAMVRRHTVIQAIIGDFYRMHSLAD